MNTHQQFIKYHIEGYNKMIMVQRTVEEERFIYFNRIFLNIKIILLASHTKLNTVSQ